MFAVDQIILQYIGRILHTEACNRIFYSHRYTNDSFRQIKILAVVHSTCISMNLGIRSAVDWKKKYYYRSLCVVLYWWNIIMKHLEYLKERKFILEIVQNCSKFHSIYGLSKTIPNQFTKVECSHSFFSIVFFLFSP